MGTIMKVEITYVDDNKKSLYARSFCVKESEYEVEVVEDGISVEYHFPKFNVKCIKRYPFLFDEGENEVGNKDLVLPEKYEPEYESNKDLRGFRNKMELQRTRSRLEFLNKKKNI